MPEIEWLANNVGTIQNLLDADECNSYIRSSELSNYEEAPVSTDRGDVVMKDVRNNDRLIVDDFGIAKKFYTLIEGVLPRSFERRWRPIGLNERFRFYRYDVGQLFNWHRDGYFERPNGERSFFTFMIYLNEDFEGGGTSFRDERFGRARHDQFTVKPKKGMGLLFHHPIVHRGDAVTSGRKYVVRTDVMFGRNLRLVS